MLLGPILERKPEWHSHNLFLQLQHLNEIRRIPWIRFALHGTVQDRSVADHPSFELNEVLSFVLSAYFEGNGGGKASYPQSDVPLETPYAGRCCRCLQVYGV